MRCDLNCPYGEPYCCRACCLSRKTLKDKYPDKWTDKFGFWSTDGCKLTRDEMPQECKDYDCKDYVFYSTAVFLGNAWRVIGLHEIKIEDRNKAFVDKYNAVFKDVE